MDLSDPISVIIPSLEGQVLRVLAHTTTHLSGSRIAELVTTGSNPGIRTALGRLVHQGTVLARRSGPSILYTATTSRGQRSSTLSRPPILSWTPCKSA